MIAKIFFYLTHNKFERERPPARSSLYTVRAFSCGEQRGNSTRALPANPRVTPPPTLPPAAAAAATASPSCAASRCTYGPYGARSIWSTMYLAEQERLRRASSAAEAHLAARLLLLCPAAVPREAARPIYVPACRAPALHTRTPMSQKYIHSTCFTSCVTSKEKPCPMATIQFELYFLSI